MSKFLSIDIDEETVTNETFRTVIFTAPHSQLVVMSLKPGEDIGMEVHDKVDQFIRIEEGQGKAILDGTEHILGPGSALVIPAGTEHNVVNTSHSERLQLYTVYSPPEHADGTVHRTKAEAMAEEHHK